MNKLFNEWWNIIASEPASIETEEKKYSREAFKAGMLAAAEIAAPPEDCDITSCEYATSKAVADDIRQAAEE